VFSFITGSIAKALFRLFAPQALFFESHIKSAPDSARFSIFVRKNQRNILRKQVYNLAVFTRMSEMSGKFIYMAVKWIYLYSHANPKQDEGIEGIQLGLHG
jgi:hypothetical protein